MRYRLKIDSNITAAVHESNPTLEGERDERFRHIITRFSQSFKIASKEDYDLIFNESYNHLFECELEYYDGATWTLEASGGFKKSDCEIDEDRGTILFKPLFRSIYDKIKEQGNTKYDIFELGVSPQNVTYNETGILQLYWFGETVMNIGRGYVNEGSDTIDWKDLTWYSKPTVRVSDDGFPYDSDPTKTALWGKIYIPDVEGAGGVYQEFGLHSSGFVQFVDETGLKKIVFEYSPFTLAVLPFLEIDSVIVGNFGVTTGSQLVKLIELTMNASGLKYDVIHFNPTFRILTNRNTVLSNPTIDIPENSTDLKRYSKYYGDFFLFTKLEMSENLQIAETEYGVVPEEYTDSGKFYLPPNDVFTWIPIFQAQWTNKSFWLKFDSTVEDLLAGSVLSKTVKAAFRATQLIEALAQKIDPLLECNFTSSNIFSNPSDIAQMGVAGAGDLHHFLIPQSNLVRNVGITPNQKLEISLNEILGGICDASNAGWRIDDSYGIQFEHLDYFANGALYGVTSVGIDATTQINERTGMAYSFRSKNYKHNLSRTHKRLQLSVNSDIGAFSSKAIEYMDEYVEDSTSDVSLPFIGNITEQLINNIPEHNWILAPCERYVVSDNNNFLIPYVSFDYAGKNYNGENGYMMPMWILLAWYRHQAASLNIEINGNAETSLSQVEIRENEIIIPYEAYNFYQLAKTLVGEGQIVKFTNDRLANQVKLTVQYVI